MVKLKDRLVVKEIKSKVEIKSEVLLPSNQKKNYQEVEIVRGAVFQELPDLIKSGTLVYIPLNCGTKIPFEQEGTYKVISSQDVIYIP